MNVPKISIIVPVYNVEKYLKKCLDSIINQTLADIEIIIVNDESPDNSYKIINLYESMDKRIKVVNRKNGGLSMARNSGLSVATGEYIGFVDSDDWIELEMFEKMYDPASKYSADIVICDYNMVFDKYIEKSILGIETDVIDIDVLGIKQYFDKYQFIYKHGDQAWNKIYKREFVRKFGIVFEKNSEIFSEDKLFNLYCLLNVKRICTLDSSFYNYLQREGSLMYEGKPNHTKRLMTLLDRFYRKAQFYNKHKDIETIFPELILQLIGNTVFNKFKIEKLGLLKVSDDLKNVNMFKFFKPSMRHLMVSSNSFKLRVFSFLLYNNLFILFLLLKKIIIEIKGIGLPKGKPVGEKKTKVEVTN